MGIYWLEQRALDAPALDSWLSAAEALRLSGMRFEKRRADWRLGRWTAKLAVSAWLDTPRTSESLRNIEVRPEPSGAPQVWIGGRLAPITISLSHRAGVAVCALAPPGVELGCDLEVAEPRTEAFLADYFTAGEQLFVEHAPVPDRPRLLALLWSAKESALKALRLGLRMDTRRLELSTGGDLQSFGASGEWRPFHISWRRGFFDGWWKQTGQLVRTAVAAPSSSAPVTLGSVVPEVGVEPT